MRRQGLPWLSCGCTWPPNVGDEGLIPGLGAKFSYPLQPKTPKTPQNRSNIVKKFNKDFKNGPHRKILGKKKWNEKTYVLDRKIHHQ